MGDADRLAVLALVALVLSTAAPTVATPTGVAGGNSTGARHKLPKPPESRIVCFRAGDIGLGGLPPVGEDGGYLASYVFNGSKWLARELLVEADTVNALPIMDPAGSLVVPVLPRRIRPETRICVEAPLVGRLPPGGSMPPMPGELVSARLGGRWVHIFVGYFHPGGGGIFAAPPPPTYTMKTYRAVTPTRLLSVGGIKPEATSPGQGGGGEVMVVGFKSRYFNMSNAGDSYCVWNKGGIEFPNGTRVVELYLTDATSRGIYDAYILLYDEEGRLLDVAYSSVTVDGGRPRYLAVRMDLLARGWSEIPVKATFKLCNTAGKTLDAVIYARIATSRYATEYMSVGAHGTPVEYYHTVSNPHLIYNDTFLMIPQVRPALGHISGSALLGASLTYYYYSYHAPPSITIYAYYGGRAVGSSTAHREGTSPPYTYTFSQWSWGPVDQAVSDSLKLMGASSDMLFGPFPELGDGVGEVYIGDVRLTGLYRPEMNRPASHVWRDLAANWLYATVSYHHNLRPYATKSSIMAVRVEVPGRSLDTPHVVIALNPYKRGSARYSLSTKYELYFTFSERVAGWDSNLYLSDSSVGRVIDSASAFTRLLNILSILLSVIGRSVASTYVGVVSFAADLLVNSAGSTMQVAPINGRHGLYAAINVGWAESKTPLVGSISVMLERFPPDYTVRLVRVRIDGLNIPTGVTGNVYRALWRAGSDVDGYRTLYCGFQEGLSGTSYYKAYKCNREAER